MLFLGLTQHLRAYDTIPPLCPLIPLGTLLSTWLGFLNRHRDFLKFWDSGIRVSSVLLIGDSFFDLFTRSILSYFGDTGSWPFNTPLPVVASVPRSDFDYPFIFSGITLDSPQLIHLRCDVNHVQGG